MSDCRAYELVTHRDLGGTYAIYPTGVLNAGREVDLHPAANSGERYLFQTVSAVPGTPDPGGWGNLNYRAQRTTGGWTQLSAEPAQAQVRETTTFGWSDDLDYIYLEAFGGVNAIDPDGRLVPEDPGPDRDVYRMDIDAGSFAWMTARPSPVQAPVGLDDLVSGLVHAAPDGESWIATGRNDLPSAPAPTQSTALWAPSSTGPEMVSILPDGSEVNNSDEMGRASRIAMISDDGEKSVFAAFSNLYLRDRALDTTVQIDDPELGAGPGTGGEVQFTEHITPDGSAVIFTTSEQLTGDDTDDQVDIYRYEAETEDLVKLSTAAPDAASDGNGESCAPGYSTAYFPGHEACAAFPIGTSQDASKVYFLSAEELAPGATADSANVYLRDQAGTRFVATLDDADATQGATTDSEQPALLMGTGPRAARLTDDGSVLVFQSRAQLTDYDNGGLREVYRYDAESELITCASCATDLGFGPNREGLLRNDNAFVGSSVAIFQAQLYVHGRNITSDGSKVYFQTEEKLAAEDINGELDVYEYDAATGSQALISTGVSPNPSLYFDNSDDGEDVFFASTETLTPPEQDLNGSTWKVFDARINGGFAAEEPEAPCQGADCKPAPADPPSNEVTGSGVFEGSGNAAPEGSAADCGKLERKVDKAADRKRKAAEKKRKVSRKKRKVSRQAKRASGKRANRLDRKVKRLKQRKQRVKQKAKKAKRKARNAKRKAHSCKRGKRGNK